MLRVEALPAAADHRLDHNEQAQQQGDDDARPPGGERPLEGDEGLDHTLDQHAEKGAWQEGHAAGHQRAADHGGGDGVHLHADGVEGIPGEHDEGVDHTGQRRAEAAHHVGEDFRPFGGKAHQLRRHLISAQRVDVPAEPGELQHQCGRNQRHQRDHHAHGDESAGQDIDPCGRQRGVHGIVNNNRLPGDDRRHAAGEELPRQRDNKGLHVEFRNQPALDQAEHSPHGQHDQDDGGRGQARVLQHLRRRHTGQRHHRADGDVNPADQQDKGDADGGNDQGRIVDQQVAEHLGLHEAPVVHHADHIQQHEQAQGDAEGKIPGTDQAVFQAALLLHLCFTAFSAVRFSRTPLNFSDWRRQIKMTTRALYTGSCSEETPSAYSVVVIVWMVMAPMMEPPM